MRRVAALRYARFESRIRVNQLVRWTNEGGPPAGRGGPPSSAHPTSYQPSEGTAWGRCAKHQSGETLHLRKVVIWTLTRFSAAFILICNRNRYLLLTSVCQ